MAQQPETNWVKELTRALSTRTEIYLNNMMQTQKDPLVKEMTKEILIQLSDLVGEEEISIKHPKTKLQQLMVVASMRLAIWINELIKDLDKPVYVQKDLQVKEIFEKESEQKREANTKKEAEEEKYTEKKNIVKGMRQNKSTKDEPLDMEKEEIDKGKVETKEETKKEEDSVKEENEDGKKAENMEEGITELIEGLNEGEVDKTEIKEEEKEDRKEVKEEGELEEQIGDEEDEMKDKEDKEEGEPILKGENEEQTENLPYFKNVNEDEGKVKEVDENQEKDTEEKEREEKEQKEKRGLNDDKIDEYNEKPEATLVEEENKETPLEQTDAEKSPEADPEGKSLEVEEAISEKQLPEKTEEKQETPLEQTEAVKSPEDDAGQKSLEVEVEILEKPIETDHLETVSKVEETIITPEEFESSDKESGDEKPITEVLEKGDASIKESAVNLFGDIMDVIKEDIAQTPKPKDETVRQKYVKDVINNRLKEIIGADIGNFELVNIEKIASKVACWIEEIMESTESPKKVEFYKDPGAAFAVNKTNGSILEVHKLRPSTVAEATAEIRGVESPHRARKMPSSESPLSLSSTQEWIEWVRDIADVTVKWGEWIDSLLTDAERQVADKHKDSLAEHRNWKQWRNQAELEARKWRFEAGAIKDEGKIWNKKLHKEEEK